MAQSHCWESPGSFDECRLSKGWLPITLKPNQSTGAVSLSMIGSYHPHPPSPLIIVTQLESRCAFCHPTDGRRPRIREGAAVGVNNLPEVVARQCAARYSNSRPLTNCGVTANVTFY